jgi:hypothetical protein
VSASPPPEPSGEGRSGALADRIDLACDRFEAAWRAGQEPAIEDYLREFATPERPALLRELVAVELELLRGRGQWPGPAPYRRRFPDPECLAAIAAAFAETAAAWPHAAAARELLFGLLALENDLIGPETLQNALNAWVVNRARPLGQFLRDSGALHDAQLDQLEALVREHLGHHQGDPARSLAALPSFGSMRRDLEHHADPLLQAFLKSVGYSVLRQHGAGPASSP